jgi:hypothetical protein
MTSHLLSTCHPVGGESGPPSPAAAVGSESPSRRQQATAESTGSRAAQPRREAAEPLTPCGPWQDAGAAVTESRPERQGGPAAVGGEDEPEHREQPGRPRTRNVVVQLPAGTAERIEAAISASGMYRTHFLSAALLLGVKRFSEQLRGE